MSENVRMSLNLLITFHSSIINLERRYTFCCTFPILLQAVKAESDGGRYPPPCPVEPGLSSPGKNEGRTFTLFRQRPSGRPVDHYNYTLPARFYSSWKACSIHGDREIRLERNAAGELPRRGAFLWQL